MNDKRKYWYRFYHIWCPVCGKDDDYKVRVYDQPKPDDWRKRHIYEEQYDRCEG